MHSRTPEPYGDLKSVQKKQARNRAWPALAAAGMTAYASAVAAADGPTPAPSPGPAPESSASIEALRKRLGEVRTVRTRFVQEKEMAVFKNRLVSRGTLLFEAPARMAWRVEEPIRYALVVDEKNARQWDGETGRLQTIPIRSNPMLQAVLDQMRMWFSGKYDALAASYEIRAVGDQPVVVEFVPREGHAAARAIRRVRITFRADGAYLAGIRIDDADGDTTTLRFEETVLDAPIAAHEWEAKPRGR